MDAVVSIDIEKYWKIANSSCEKMDEFAWWHSTDDELNKLIFGLKEIVEIKNPNLKFFKIVDPKKYLWAKLKYGI